MHGDYDCVTGSNSNSTNTLAMGLDHPELQHKHDKKARQQHLRTSQQKKWKRLILFRCHDCLTESIVKKYAPDKYGVKNFTIDSIAPKCTKKAIHRAKKTCAMTYISDQLFRHNEEVSNDVIGVVSSDSD